MSREVALEVMQEVQAEEDALLSLRANDELTKLSNHLVDAAILRHLADRSLSLPPRHPPCIWVWVWCGCGCGSGCGWVKSVSFFEDTQHVYARTH